MTSLEIRVTVSDNSDQVRGLRDMSHHTANLKASGPGSEKAVADYPSPAMRAALKKANSGSQQDITVLLLGESGSGKDFIARLIHDNSKRSAGPFFSINCAALTSQLAESELFGHEKGAFTGAHDRKRGLLEMAENGTLLLNEIGELAPELQAKLLTFLDTKKVTRVGGEKEVSVHARLIAATNSDLRAQIAEGRFRKDLFFRINVLSITVPPLRERREDIPKLVQEIVRQLMEELRFQDFPAIDPRTLNRLKKYLWPGNVRELRNVLERAMILSDGKHIDLQEIGLEISNSGTTPWSFSTTFTEGRPLNEVAAELKRSYILEALKRAGGRRQEAARMLGISRYSLKHYMKTLEIPEDD